MGRLLEATQFVVQDYDLFKAGGKFENPLKVCALEKLAEQEKDPKSELNTRCGGIANVRRIRVLRDSDIKEVDAKFLTLTFDLKSQPREIARQKMDEEIKKARSKNMSFPMWVPDMKILVSQSIETAIDALTKSGMPFEEEISKLKGLKAKVEEIANIDDVRKCRLESVQLMNLTKEDGNDVGSKSLDTKKLMSVYLDIAQCGLGMVQHLGSLFDREQFIAHAKRLMGPKPQFNKSGGKPQGKGHQNGKPGQKQGQRPQNRPQAAQKPQSPPQA